MDFNGHLTAKDALRLLRTLRFVRGRLGEAEKVIAGKFRPLAPGTIFDKDEEIAYTVGEVADKVLREYEEYE